MSGGRITREKIAVMRKRKSWKVISIILRMMLVYAVLICVALLFNKGDAYADEKKDYKFVINNGANVPDIYNIESIKINYIDDLNAAKEYVVGDKSSDFTNIASEKRTVFNFKTDEKIKSVNSVTIKVKHSGTSTYSWTIKSMTVYKVDEEKNTIVSGYSTSGYSSGKNNKQEIFSGTIISNTKKQCTLNWNTADEFVFGKDNKADYKIEDMNKKYSTDACSKYFVTLNFSDFNESGIDTLRSTKNTGTTITNYTNTNTKYRLRLTVEYSDVNGASKTEYIDIMQAYMDYIKNNVDGASKNKIVGSALDGDTIGCPVNILDCDTIDSVELEYYNKWDANDFIQLQYVAFYNMNNIKVNPQYKQFQYELGLTGTPTYWWDGTDTGKTFQNSTTEKYNLGVVKWEEGSYFKTRKYKNAYLVEIKTDSTKEAGTFNKLSFKLDYITTAGRTGSTILYDAEERAYDYYGAFYGNALSYVWKEIPYRYYMKSGNTIRFIVYVTDVERFTTAKISLGNDTKGDNWQFTSMGIYSLSSLSVRTGNISDTLIDIDGKLNTYITYDREAVKKYTYAFYKGKVLFNPGTTKTISFPELSHSANGDIEIPVVENKYGYNAEMASSMDYKTACSSLYFDKVRASYSISVLVADDKTTEQEGDCGSYNKFYFKLIFENGESAYVLANQQLESDRFREGKEELFLIKCAQEYGDVVGIKIIPEDTASDSKTFDKLKIDRITVSKSGSSGANKSWLVDNIGWIGIDYSDEGQTVFSDEGRGDSQYISEFYVTDVTYNYELCFIVNTALNSNQFTGTVSGTLTYYDLGGDKQTMSFDLAQKCYEYTEREIQRSGSNALATSAMFKPGMQEQFSLIVPNLKQIDELKIVAVSNTITCSEWIINSVSAKIIQQRGEVVIDDNDQYIREGSFTELAKGDDTDYVIRTSVNNNASTIVKFTENDIDVSDVMGQWAFTVSRKPETTVSSLNVYLTPGPDEDAAFTGEIGYYDSFGNLKRHSLKYTYNKEKKVYVVSGIKLSDFATISYIAVNSKDVGARVMNATVEVVKGGIVTDNFYIEYSTYADGMSVGFGVSAGPVADHDYGYSQEILFQPNKASIKKLIAEDKAKAVLKSEIYDVAVAIRYIPTYSIDNKVVRSAYVYLTDEDINNLNVSGIITLKMNVPNVGVVKGINIVGTGGLSFDIDSSIIKTYYKSGEASALTGYYSIAGKFTVKKLSSNIDVTNSGTDSKNQTAEVRYTFKTAASSTEADAVYTGVREKVRMKVSYKDNNNMIKTVNYDDIRDYVEKIEGEEIFDTGTQNVVNILVNNAVSIEKIEIMPYDDDEFNNAKWKLESIAINMDNYSGNMVSKTELINGWAYEDKPLVITVKSMKMVSSVAVGKDRFLGSEAEEETVINVKPGEEVTLVSEVVNSADGIIAELTCEDRTDKPEYTVVNKRNIAQSAADSIDGLEDSLLENAYVFDNTGTKAVTYQLKTYAKEKTSVLHKYTIIVSTLSDEERLDLITIAADVSGDSGVKTVNNGKLIIDAKVGAQYAISCNVDNSDMGYNYSVGASDSVYKITKSESGVLNFEVGKNATATGKRTYVITLTAVENSSKKIEITFKLSKE